MQSIFYRFWSGTIWPNTIWHSAIWPGTKGELKVGLMTEKPEKNTVNEIGESRREFMKAAGRLAVYTPPVLVVLMKPTLEAIAASGATTTGCNNGVGNGPDCLPPGLEKNGKGSILDNDDNGGTPGNPQNKGGNK